MIELIETNAEATATEQANELVQHEAVPADVFIEALDATIADANKEVAVQVESDF